MTSLTVYCNADLPAPAAALLREEVAPHRLLFAGGGAVGVLGQGAPDKQLDEAEVVFGQPDPRQIMEAPGLRWVQLSSAGYARYDRPDLMDAFRRRGAALTKSSLVYDDACALHVLAFICAHARQLPGAWEAQRGARDWPQASLRARSRLLQDESVVLVGFGAIGRRLVQLLEPLKMRISAIRRQPAGDEPVPTHAVEAPAAARALAIADHVVNILPDSASTERFFDAARIAAFKPGVVFYNIGRGSTVAEDALQAALTDGRVAAAYLDVTSSEPLPPENPLWSAPNCFITPHTGGGHATESVRLVRHFLDNLVRFASGEPLLDRVV
ncbi:MAG: D-2-hydroxyacid dehydrogenase [Myxococcales bacterium]